MFRDLVLRTRSRRRFYEATDIPPTTLRGFVDLARQCASTRNAQPLKYVLSTSRDMNARIFPLLSWAGYFKEWGGPEEGERPAGYVILLGDTRISQSFETDAGIAAQTILLAATDAGLGGCVVGSVKREALAAILSLPEHLKILYVMGMGTPKEKVVLEAMPPDGNVRYWRDAEGVHHVPKRGLDEVLVGAFD
jgi:nitroreductase